MKTKIGTNSGSPNSPRKSGRWRPPWRRNFRACVILFGIIAGVATFCEEARPAPAAFRSDRILIKPKEGAPLNLLTNLHARLGNRVLRKFPRIANWHVLQLSPGASVSNHLAAYRMSGLVARAEPDYVMHVATTVNPTNTLEPDDFYYVDTPNNGELWNFRNPGLNGGVAGADISAPAGWFVQNSASNIIVAIVDTGIRYTHEDLAANMWTSPVDGSHGINTVSNGFATNDPFDDFGHGTHVSGIIGAAGNNSFGVVGVCWQVQLMACKFIDSSGSGSISDAITCIDYAITNGAKVINASWGTYSFTSAALRDAVNSLRDADVIFVAAAGNNSNDNDANSLFPASYEYDNVIAVAATDRSDNLAFFSNYGATTVRLGAPGSPIFSCWNGSDSDYRYDDGTSMATPHVAGACALVWAHYPGETHSQIIRRVLNGVDPLPALAGKCTTGGRLNLYNALTEQSFPMIAGSATNDWVDDAVPDGAMTDTGGGDSWNWVTNNPVPFSGTMAHQSNIADGVHYHQFEMATNTMEVFTGDRLFAYVYLDPDNPPSEVMLAWNDGCWEHRAYWGQNLLPWGSDGTSNRQPMGDLPATGEWVKLEVPASMVGLEGAVLKGMSFILVDGGATWDFAGRCTPPGS